MKATSLYDIKINLLTSSEEVINNNLNRIAISIDKNQDGIQYLYSHKKLTVFFEDISKSLDCEYIIIKNNSNTESEYLSIESTQVLTDNNITFNASSKLSYNEYYVNNNFKKAVENSLFDNNIFNGIPNNSEVLGRSGLINPIQLGRINQLNFKQTIDDLRLQQITGFNLHKFYLIIPKDKNKLNFQIAFENESFSFIIEFNINTVKTKANYKIIELIDNNSSYNLFFYTNINFLSGSNNDNNCITFNLQIYNLENSDINSNVNVSALAPLDFVNKNYFHKQIPLDLDFNSEINLISEYIYQNFISSNNKTIISNEKFTYLTGNENTILLNYGKYLYNGSDSNKPIFNDFPEFCPFYLDVLNFNIDKLNANTVQILYCIKNNGDVNIYYRFIDLFKNIITNWKQILTNKSQISVNQIITDSTHRFVSDSQIKKWNESSNNSGKVNTKSELPMNGNADGDILFVVDEQEEYVWKESSNSWILLSKFNLITTNQSKQLSLTFQKNNKDISIITLPEATNSTNGLLSAEFHSMDFVQKFKENLNFTINTAGSVAGNYTKQLGTPFNVNEVKNVLSNEIYFTPKDGLINYLNPLTINNDNVEKKNIIINLNSFEDIHTTLYSKYDTNNYIANEVTKKSFIIKNCNSTTTKLKLNISYQNTLVLKGSSTVTKITTSEYELPNTIKDIMVEFIKINDNIFQLTMVDISN